MADAINTRLAEIDARLPCPFCGNAEPQIRSNGIGDYYVICDTEWEGEMACGARSSDSSCETESGAVMRWNRRALDASQSVTRLREELRKAHAERDKLKEDFAAHEKYVDECVQEKLDEMGADAASFDKELWKVINRFLTNQPGFSWSDYADGIDADGVGEWLRETMHAMDEQAKRLTAARDNAEKEMQERCAKDCDGWAEANENVAPREKERIVAYRNAAASIRALTKDGAT